MLVLLSVLKQFPERRDRDLYQLVTWVVEKLQDVVHDPDGDEVLNLEEVGPQEHIADAEGEVCL